MRTLILTLALGCTLGACSWTKQQPAEGPAMAVDTVPRALEVGLASDAALEPVQMLASARYELRRGETLAHFARWAELPIEAVAGASNIPLDGRSLTVGTAVVVPVDNLEHRSLVERSRDAHHRRRAQGYLESRGGSMRSEPYIVRSGETAWSIARDHGNLPVWLVESFNPSVNVDQLRPGHRLLLPVLATTVALRD